MFYDCSTMDRVRFDPELLDEHDPFEIDDANRAHLAKHYPYSADDLVEAWHDPNRLFVAATAEGPADWLLVARLPGGRIVQIPVAPPHHGDWRTCRPVAIYEASAALAAFYEEDR
jgi:hypothetical protein